MNPVGELTAIVLTVALAVATALAVGWLFDRRHQDDDDWPD